MTRFRNRWTAPAAMLLLAAIVAPLGGRAGAAAFAGADIALLPMLGAPPSPFSATREKEVPVLLAAGDCSGAASQAAAETGGQVLSVSSRSQGGRTVCIVTILIPGEGGGRPRKTTVTVPQ